MLLARGYIGAKSKIWKVAVNAVRRSWKYQYRHRRERKRNLRALWNTRIGAAAKICGTNYSRLINGLKKSHILLNRKMLASIAISDPDGFRKIVEDCLQVSQ